MHSSKKIECLKQIEYLARAKDWKQKEFGAKLEGHHGQPVDQSRISRWYLGKETPPARLAPQIEELCYQTILEDFGSPNGFRYICNISNGYGGCFETREAQALERLRAALVRNCPFAPVGLLQIIVLEADLPDGERAQCFRSDPEPARSYFILVRKGDDQALRNARDEVFAHVLRSEPASGVVVTED